MSHWFQIQTSLSSESAIKKAGNKLGYMVVHNQNCRGYNNQKTKCDLVLKLPGEYDLGFQKNEQGSYDMVADFWGNHISDHLADTDVLQSADEFMKEKIAAGEWDYAKGEAYLNDAKISKFMQTYNRFAVEELIQQQGLQYVETVQTDGTIILEVVGV